jgi:hypothetical protein
LAQIGKYSAIFAVIYANAPHFKDFSPSNALAARTNEVDSNGRARSLSSVFLLLAIFKTFVTRYNGKY